MTRKIYFVMTMFLSISLFAQTDDMKEKATDAGFRMGQSNYKAKPKNAWELGVHVGHFFIDGDVDRTIPGGYGLGLHLRKAIHYAFSIRADLFYGNASGLEPQPYTHSSVPHVVGEHEVGGSLVEPEYAPYANNPQGWFPSHKTRQVYGVMQGIVNVGNILFHKPSTKWNWYLGVGAGLSNHLTKLDLLDGSGKAYPNLITASGFSASEFDTKAGRGRIKANLNSIYDGVYETEGPKKAGIFRLGDETNIHVMFTGSVGVARKISNRINIGLEHQVMATDNDYLDGIRFLNSVSFTQDVDIEHYTNLRLAINIGKMDGTTEPLYWVNPLDATMNDLAELKARPELDLTDSDSDGVIDMMDQEDATPTGCAVDTRGVMLDSDNDGIADCKDKEPYSPIGYQISKDGVANVKKCESCLTEADVFRMIDSRTPKTAATTTVVSNECGKWFLPMIHYDLDKYSIKPEFYGHLHHVATVLKQCPSTCVSVVGHTDVRSSNNYNNVLSYNRAQAAIDYLVTNYGIDRSRLHLMYGGEDAPMVGGSKGNYMNRRVEFRVCDPSDTDMGRPEGPSAGNGGRGKTGSGSAFKGNKNSGY